MTAKLAAPTIAMKDKNFSKTAHAVTAHLTPELQKTKKHVLQTNVPSCKSSCQTALAPNVNYTPVLKVMANNVLLTNVALDSNY